MWTYDYDLSFLFLNVTWIKSIRIQLQEKSPIFDKLSGCKSDAIKFESTQMHCFSDVFTADVVVIA